MVAALPDLLVLALFVFALALALATKKVTQALLGGLISALQSIPVIGGKLASPLEAAEAAITRAMDDLVSGIEKGIGKAWHLQARLLDWTWEELRHHARALLQIATPVGTLLEIYHGIRSLVHGLTTTAHGLGHRVKTLEREYHGIEHRVKTLAHDLTQGIGHDVLPRIRSLDREVAKIEDKVIPNIRSIAQGAENEVTALRKWVTDHALVAGTAAFIGAVAAALSALGLGWLRCEANPFHNNKNACGLWGDLANLLAIAAIPLEIASLYELIDVAQTVTEGITQGVEDLLQV